MPALPIRHPVQRPIGATLRRAPWPLVALVACGTETWHADLPSDASAPIAVRSVTARRTTAAQVGLGGVALSSDSPKNGVSFELEVVVQQELPVGALLGTRNACSVDGMVWATRFSANAELRVDQLGTPQTSFAEPFIGHAFAAGPPTACEVSLRMQPGRIGLDVPDFAPVDLGRFCWTPEGITAAACPDAALPRAVPNTTVVIGPMQAQWHPADASDRGGLAFAAQVTVGVVAEHGDLTAAAACIGDNAPMQSRSVLLAGLRDYVPGDSFAIASSAFTATDFVAPPSRCTIEVRHRARSPLDGGRFVPAASFCLDAGAVTDGACDGLAPGPAIVRVDGGAALDRRGAHREGPFAIDDADVADRVVRSVKATRDEGIVIVAPRSMAHAEVLKLVTAAKAAKLDVAMSTP
jgi:hypothetical protein